MDTYTGEDGIGISDRNVISIQIDSENANGLGKDANGLKLELAKANGSGGSGGSAGAMSADDKTKLDNIETATDSEVEQMLDGIFDSGSDEPGIK